MGIKKYINDYRKEYIVKPNGKPGMTAVYIGKYYRFSADEESIKRARLVFACLSAFAIACCIIPFCYMSSASHTMYVAIPHVIALFPLAHLAMGVGNLYFRKPPFIREFKDKTEDRIIRSSMGSMCCLGVTAVAQIVNLALSGVTVGDAIYLALIILSCAALGYIYSSRRVLATEECDANGD